jgi:hypothetical protein
MPNFDGKGPLNRGQVIGRGRGACMKNDQEYKDTSRDAEPETNDSRKAA